MYVVSYATIFHYLATKCDLEKKTKNISPSRAEDYVFEVKLA